MPPPENPDLPQPAGESPVPNQLAPDQVSVGADEGAPVALAPPAPARGGAGLWLRDVLISIGASILIITFLYQPVRVEGTSMLPRLEDHDRLFINKFVYHIEKIHRDDVVVFHYPRDPQKSYIKRVIAVPGDTLRIDRGRVYVNGKLLDEPYVPEEYRDARSTSQLTLAPNTYFVMGDHRSISSDSRDFGPVQRNLIYGKAVFIYWPTQDAGVVR